MEGNTNVQDNTNLLSAIERLSTQVQLLQTTVNSQQTSSRRTVTLEENEGSGDDGGSESRKDNKGRHTCGLTSQGYFLQGFAEVLYTFCKEILSEIGSWSMKLFP